MGHVLLKLDDLSCERDDRALFSGLNFNCLSGDIIQVEGPNGSGKTTLLRILSGLYQNYEGQVIWNEQSISSQLSTYQSELLMIGHKSPIRTDLSAIENLRFLIGIKQRVEDQKLFSALEKVGLYGYEDTLCRNLSAGQQRRVNLARMYISSSKLWILDEVFTAIDKSGVVQFESLLAKKSLEGVTIILTTHHQLAIDSRKLSLGFAGQRAQS